MNATSFADLVNARPVGSKKWLARCPAHDDGSPSLSIREGRDERVLISCFAGCSHTSITKALGIRLSDLFAGPPPSSAQVAELARKRELENRTRQVKRAKERALEDHVRRLEAVRDSVGAKLARRGDGTEGDALSVLLHQACELHRVATTELEDLYREKAPL